MSSALLVLLAATACLAADVPTNMNGEYLIANPNYASGVTWDSSYASRNGEYFDVYSPNITTVYGEVFWTMMDAVPLPADIVARFANKTIAILGYEVDQVYRTPQGDQSVPIIWAYNHHYEAYLMGAHATLESVQGNIKTAMGMNHGAPNYWKIVSSNTNISPDIPDAQFFSEGNGGEFRKSFHGYPKGFAQLLYSPTTFKIQPMQIDTHNRDYHGPGFKAGILPRSSAAPPNATYSGLLECPCTTRTVKQWTTVYTTAIAGTCQVPLGNSSECFAAVAKISGPPTTTTIVQSAALPTGCSMYKHVNGSVDAIFNTLSTAAQCGAGARLYAGSVSSTVTDVGIGLQLDTTVAGGLATITLIGPSDVWFGVGFNANAMADKPYTIIVDGKGNVTERKLGDHDPGSQIASQVVVKSNTVVSGVRTVVLTRAFNGATADHYTFNPATTSLPLINAVGNTPQLAFHKNRTSTTLTMAAVEASTCVCDGGTHGTINGLSFQKYCAPEPTGDLLQQKNPTCWIQTYQGGLSCCHHGDVLLDADQPVDSRKDTYNLKFRFWFNDYVPAAPPAPASHRNLHRFYFTTEAFAGEYDVVQCPKGTPSSECVQEITSRWQVKDMVDCTFDPYCHEGSNINLIYAGGHCHAPSCISLELYNMDTGDLLCRQEPVYGTGAPQPFDELGYLALPPCLWGPASEGLTPPTLLTWTTNLMSIKRNNNTYTHYGEMASWQMRGVYV